MTKIKEFIDSIEVENTANHNQAILDEYKRTIDSPLSDKTLFTPTPTTEYD